MPLSLPPLSPANECLHHANVLMQTQDHARQGVDLALTTLAQAQPEDVDAGRLFYTLGRATSFIPVHTPVRVRQEMLHMGQDLVRLGATITEANISSVQKCLDWAVDWGHAELLGLLLGPLGGAGLVQNAQEGRYLVHACRQDCPAVVELLLQQGAPVDRPYRNFGTPLMAAVWNGFTENAKLLLAAGADVHAREDDGLTVLSTLECCTPELVQLLLDRGADWTHPDRNDLTPLDHARLYPSAGGAYLIATVEQRALDTDTPPSGNQRAPKRI